MNRKSIVALLAICLSSVAASVQAAGPYVGVLGGSIETQQRHPYLVFELNEEGESVLVESGMTSTSEDRSAYGAVFGWQLHRNFALETAYVRATTKRDTLDDATTLEFGAGAWTASALYTLPLSSRWSTYARLGGIRRTSKASIGFQGNAPVTYSGHRDGILFGAGAGLRIKQLNLRFDLQRTTIQSERTTVMSIGANWFL